MEEKLGKAREHEKKLGEYYVEAEAEALKLNDCMAELQVADNEEQRLRNLHDTLLERMANIDVKQNRADVQVSIVSEPRAGGTPISPRLSLVAMLCLIGGLGVGVAIVYIQDLLDDRFRSPEELKEQCGVPLLAMVRKLPVSHEVRASTRCTCTSTRSSVETEAFRTLRTTLAFSGQEVQRLAITSSEPGDGKTTVLANLGSHVRPGRQAHAADRCRYAQTGTDQVVRHARPGRSVGDPAVGRDVVPRCVASASAPPVPSNWTSSPAVRNRPTPWNC